ncbi:MAG: hypothetical protein ING30_07705 [Burkholderiales bacterium]|nr:hypothetical protein [Burkholderiales bacterium]MCA6254453.1 hypothetical protein [Phenylobacterium sp.]
MLPPLAEHLDAEGIHVQAPFAVVFICGGKTSSVSQEIPESIRDAFLKIPDKPIIRDRKFILAEEIDIFYKSRQAYRDLLEFEMDLAQITELIVLFSESSGSFVELGAFSVIPEISERLLVVIRDTHYREESFINLGPILHLTNRYSDSVVCVIEDSELNISGNKVSSINKSNLYAALEKPISERINQIRQFTTFNQSLSGHMIKLIVGLIQEYGALTINEIESILPYANINKTQIEIDSYLLCAESVDWIKKDKKGVNTFFFARPGRDAASFRFKDTVPNKDRVRRRQTVREHWRSVDPERYRGIVQWLGGKI